MKEVEFIKELKSNNPSVGYNQWPKFNMIFIRLEIRFQHKYLYTNVIKSSYFDEWKVCLDESKTKPT